MRIPRFVAPRLEQFENLIFDRCETILAKTLDLVRSTRPKIIPGTDTWRIVGGMPESIYRSEFEPTVLKLGCKRPTHILTFHVGLPFDLRVAPGTYYTQRVGRAAACTVTVHRNIIKQRPPALSVIPPHPDEPFFETGVAVAELVGYITTDPTLMQKGFSQAAMSDIFDLMLEALNTYIAGYLMATRDPQVHFLGLKSVQPVVLFLLWPVDHWDNRVGGVFLTNIPGLQPPMMAPISGVQTQRMLHVAQLYENRNNPFVSAELHLIQAEALEGNGNHRGAVIEANTGIEVFISSLFISLASEEGMSQQDIDNRIAGGKNFLSIIKNEFHPRLGGRWDVEIKTIPIGEWYSKVYRLRCRVVHGGYHPNYEQASGAIRATQDFRSWLIKQVRSKQKKYPKTALYFLPTTYPPDLFKVFQDQNGNRTTTESDNKTIN